jgi:hypothetical protein
MLRVFTYLVFKPNLMKTVRYFIILCTLSLVVSSCNLFKANQRGCPTNGKNVGAEQLLGGEKPPKAKKFRA